ncbi:creatininase family protein [Candidatus Bathyarchaeota archaeon]|nr:creatininase family protein [Candidatus Bathyarchaeota archaeon]
MVKQDSGVPERKYVISEMTSPEVKEAMKETGIVIVHVGSMEQHGPHLPIKTDTSIGATVSRKAAAKFYKETGRRVLVAPSIPFGMSLHHMSYPGTISLQPETLVTVMTEVCLGLASQGFKKILITSSHGGNMMWTDMAARKIFEGTDSKVLLLKTVWTKNQDDDWTEYLKSGRAGSGHAGETETSIMMALGEPVRMDKLPKEPTNWRIALPDFQAIGDEPKISGLSTMGTYNVEDICDGYMGDPSQASAETGKKILENWSNNILELLRQYDEL